MPSHKRILLTGVAGFIGMATAIALRNAGMVVTGVDNLNDYYSPQMKRDRLARIMSDGEFEFVQIDLADRVAAEQVFDTFRPDAVIHLAAQAGINYSLQNPHAFVQSNLVAFLNVLEGCRRHAVHHLIFASSSSVYGANTKMPFSTRDPVDHPLSLYAATKKANELMAHSYAHLYQLPVTGLRMFTVYGPWGRPDMAYYKFTKAIFEGRPIEVYDEGKMRRDFTYIDDVVESVVTLLALPPAGVPSADRRSLDPTISHSPYRIYNVGNSRAIELWRYIEVLEQAIGKKAIKEFKLAPRAHVSETCADMDDLRQAIGFEPKTTIEVGVPQFVEWYRRYHNV